MASKYASLSTEFESVFDENLFRVLSKFDGIEQSSHQQSTALKYFLSGSDTFVSLPAGHGKRNSS